jgi:hypothetical protein
MASTDAITSPSGGQQQQGQGSQQGQGQQQQSQSPAQAAHEKGQQAAHQAAEKVHGAGQQAAQAIGGTRRRVEEQVDQRTTQAGEQVGAFATALRKAASSLDEEGQSQPAGAANQIAQRVEHVQRYLDGADAQRLTNDAKQVARDRPWAVAGVGLALGFAAARFLKASGSGQGQGSSMGSNGGSTGAYRTLPDREAHGVATTPAIPAPGSPAFAEPSSGAIASPSLGAGVSEVGDGRA